MVAAKSQFAGRSSFIAPSKKADKPVVRLNPRRLLYAGRIASFLQWRGSKVFMTVDRYLDIADEYPGMQTHSVDQALDDLFDLGCIEMTVSPGAKFMVVTLLSSDVAGEASRA